MNVLESRYSVLYNNVPEIPTIPEVSGQVRNDVHDEDDRLCAGRLPACKLQRVCCCCLCENHIIEKGLLQSLFLDSMCFERCPTT